jgi:hypothetical protein
MKADVKPRFEVHKLEGKGERRIATPKIKLDKDGEPMINKEGNSILLGGFDYEDKKVDAGWMVYFPNGSSIHVWTKDEMERQGFLHNPGLINMETGDSVDIPEVQSLKARSEQKERVTKDSKPHHTN